MESFSFFLQEKERSHMWLYICIGLLVVVLVWVVYDTGHNMKGE